LSLSNKFGFGGHNAVFIFKKFNKGRAEVPGFGEAV
jgi:hypothetical protein